MGSQQPPGRRPRWALTVFRVIATAQAVLVLLQPVLAGRFLSGDFPSLRAHQDNALVVAGLALVQVLAAVLAWRIGRLPVPMIVLSGVLLALDVVQVGLRFSRVLAIHVPLGIVIVGGATGIAGRAWRVGTSSGRRVDGMAGIGSERTSGAGL